MIRTDKVKKDWDVDKNGEVNVSFPADLDFYGIKIAMMGYETLVIPAGKDTNKTITVKMLEAEKCSHVYEAGTQKELLPEECKTLRILFEGRRFGRLQIL